MRGALTRQGILRSCRCAHALVFARLVFTTHFRCVSRYIASMSLCSRSYFVLKKCDYGVGRLNEESMEIHVIGSSHVKHSKNIGHTFGCAVKTHPA